VVGVQALMMPDLIAFLLAGQRRTEATNAPTTGLFDAVAGERATEFLTAVGLWKDLFPPLIQTGETVGTLLPAIAAQVGLPQETRVVHWD
jgi:rhamnulokinase